MIVLTFLYDEKFDRPKMSKQKNPFEYIFPLSKSRVETIKIKKIQQLEVL